MSETSDPTVLGYNGAHGKSSYLIRCGCGELFDFYVWSNRKRCGKCRTVYVYGSQGVSVVKGEHTIPVKFNE
jgi:hypothetical protein